MQNISFLQIHLNRCRSAHDLLENTARINKIDILLLSEPNSKLVEKSHWMTDKHVDAAICILNRELKIAEWKSEEGFLWININEIKIYS